MKRFWLVSVLCVLSSLSAFTQGFYFDIGIGAGKATTTLGGADVLTAMGSGVKDVGVDVGLKLGFSPFGSLPLFVVCDLRGAGHRVYDSYNYIQFNSYLVGPGIVWYPISFLQIGASFGYSFVANQSDLPIIFYKSERGYAWNASAAFDIGGRNQGCLLGVEYAYASNILEVSCAEQRSSLIGIFVRYAFRQK